MRNLVLSKGYLMPNRNPYIIINSRDLPSASVRVSIPKVPAYPSVRYGQVVVAAVVTEAAMSMLVDVAKNP
jgi:hypothetical protein